ncbi:MAG: tetratricopeptide repeat protein [Proteobacteria bacterium]|nr:tetratricopeptide repeat protein [Pseudomonadota bacterium]
MNKFKGYLISFFAILFILGVTVNIGAAGNLLEKGIAEYKAENYEESLVILIEARNQQPESSVAAFYTGLAFKQVGNLDEAQKHLKDAIRLTPPVVEAYTNLIEILYNLNKIEEAKKLIEKAEKENIKPSHIAFLKGLIFAKEGDAEAAIKSFQKAKTLDASISQAADFQIALAHAKKGKFKTARESLKAIVEVDPASELASFAKEYEKSIDKTLALHKTWNFSIGAAYQFDDNPVSADGAIVSKSEDSSMVNTFRASYNPYMEGPWTFGSIINFYANTYDTTDELNVINPSISLIPGYNFKNGILSVPVSYNHTWLHDHKYMSLASAKPTLNIMMVPGHIAQFSVGFSNREMLKPPLMKEEDRDGEIYNAGAGYIYPFANNKGMFNLRYEYSKTFTEGINWENYGNRLSAGMLFPVKHNVNLMLSGDIFIQRFNNEHTTFNLRRKDKVYSCSAGIIWEMVKGLNVNLQYYVTRTDSNITIYDYKRNIFTAGLEYRF